MNPVSLVENPGVDQVALQELYRRDRVARAILDHVGNRRNEWKESTVDGLLRTVEKSAVDATRLDVVEVLKELEGAGCGRFVVGRRGKPSRFVWGLGMVAVGRLAAGKPVPSEDLQMRCELQKEKDGEPDEDELTEAVPKTLVHVYHLRPSLRPIVLELPEDLTVTEAGRLAAFIRTLPIEQEL